MGVLKRKEKKDKDPFLANGCLFIFFIWVVTMRLKCRTWYQEKVLRGHHQMGSSMTSLGMFH